MSPVNHKVGTETQRQGDRETKTQSYLLVAEGGVVGDLLKEVELLGGPLLQVDVEREVPRNGHGAGARLADARNAAS